jgi:hypothetical protein
VNDERAAGTDGHHGNDEVLIPEGGQPAAGYALIPGIVPASWAARLQEEASRLRSSAARRERRGFELTADSRMLGPLRNWYAGDGTVDKDSEELGGVAARLTLWSGERMEPMHSSYLYYARGDFLGLHRDHVSCALTVLVWLSGPAGPLYVHPELQDLDEQSLLRAVNQWNGHPPGGVEVDIRRGPVVLRGHVVPHDRPPHPHGEELILTTLCFSLAS